MEDTMIKPTETTTEYKGYLFISASWPNEEKRFGDVKKKGTVRRNRGHGYMFKDQTSLEVWFQKHRDRIDAMAEKRVAKTTERKAARAAFKNPYSKGTILYRSWGYDQTNISFFEVTKVSPASVEVTSIASVHVKDTGFMTNTVVASLGEYTGKPQRKVFQHYNNGSVYLGSLSPWDGKPLNESHYA